MPAQRWAAPFEPISPDLDLDALVEECGNFEYVPRIQYDLIEAQGLDEFNKLVVLHVIAGGGPLVVEGCHRNLDAWTFSSPWLRDNFGQKFEQATNLTKKENLPLSIKHYLSNMPMLAAQWKGDNYRDANRQRLYLKDIDCPPLWHDKLKEYLPPSVFYLNDSIGELGGAGAREERYANGVGSRLGRGIAKAGDLMSCMPPNMRAENLMCYIGHEGTYTPAHREMCASLGQNIMVETSGSTGEDGKPTKPGSSIWFMTETRDRHTVSEYWLSHLGHDIEVEGHFASIEAWRKAPFKVWIVEQQLGDFILIPPLAPHQVWNRGTRTMKVAWNRTTVETLELALREALPRARMVCRDEQYKNKAIILFTLNKYSGLLKSVERQKQITQDDVVVSQLTNSLKIRQLQKDFRRLFTLFIGIMLSETISSPVPRMEYVPYDSNITCSYCRCNIFNRFLTCKHCIIPLENGEEDTYDICMECYAMGRSCRCVSKLTWVEQFPARDLKEKYDIWRNQIAKLPELSDLTPPLPLDEEKERFGRKTLADVCNEQLKLRPFKDPKKQEGPDSNEDDNEEEEVEVKDDGTVKNRTKKKPEKWYKDHLRCHICCKRHVKWKMATCSCGVSICYGSLWRAFDTMPQVIMEDPNWRCPKCRKICSCRDCRKDPENQPYEPKGTVLGHDTRKFADPRSVESLVDFSASNMYWVRKAGDDTPGSRRLSRHADAAALERARDPALGDDYVNERNNNDAIVIDPALAPDSSPDDDDGEGEQVGIQQAAADALNMMGGLSALERDPQAFIAQAGIGRQTPEQSYEYPDPDDDVPSIMPTTEADEVPASDKKKKKTRDVPLVQSDAALSEANAKFQRHQAQVRMKEAKKKGHYISTQAAIRGRSLLLRLPVDPVILARMSQNNPPEPMHIEPEENEEPVIVQSDLPKNVPDSVAQSRNPQVPKKRQRVDEDEDFVANKKEKRASGKMSGGKKLTSNIQEEPARSDTDMDMDAEHDPEEEITATQTRKYSNGTAGNRRSLPSYLARRSPVDTAELPSELLGTAPKRVKNKPAQMENGDLHLSTTASSSNSISTPAQVSPTIQSNGGAVVGTTIHGDTTQKKKQVPKAPTAFIAQPVNDKNPTPSTPSDLDAGAHIEPSVTVENSYKEQIKTPKASLVSRAKPKAVSKQVSANMKAKLIASGQAVESESDTDSDSDRNSPAPEVISDQKTPPSAKRGRGRPPKASPANHTAAKTSAAKPPPPSERKSIFSKVSRGGKIKIASARTLAKG